MYHKGFKSASYCISMQKKYISFDIESSGPTPGKYSMLSLGACIVGDTSVQFYREIKPISNQFVTEAMRVSSLGLKCLEDFKTQEEYNPQSEKFNPAKVLEVLKEKGEEPAKVMAEYADWIKTHTVGYKPVEAAAPIKFDGMFTAWYFDNFYPRENPLGFSGEDMNSLYRGVMQNVNASMKDLKLRDERGLAHNALEDAIQQAKEFEAVLSIMKINAHGPTKAT